MKLRAKLVYVRDHDLQQGDKGTQKVLQFQTAGGSDIRLTLLTHTGEHEGHPTPTVKHRLKADGSSDVLSRDEIAKHLAAGASVSIANQHFGQNAHQELTVPGDEGKEFEITITPV